MDCLQSIMIASFPQKALNLLLTTILLSAICSGSPTGSVDDKHRQLILKGTSVFSATEELKGFEVFHQELDGHNTIYTSADNPKFKFSHAGDDVSPGVNVVILDPSEDNLPRKDKVFYVLLRKRKQDAKTFTAHLVYVRKFKGENSLEWDYFLSDESKEKWSFTKAFSPEKFLSSFYGVTNARPVRDIMAAPGLPVKKVKKDSSSEENAKKKKKKKKEESEEEEVDDKGKKKKKKHKKEESEEEEPELPPECKDDKKPKRRKRKQPKVVYKININHIICASGGDCKPDPCLGKGKKDDKEKDKGKGRSMMGMFHAKEPLFVGFGICPKVDPPKETLEKPQVWTGETELIAFMLQTLRVQCIPQAVPQIKELFDKKVITADEKFHLELNADHHLLHVKAPGMAEWSELSAAVYFKVYSNTYFEEAGKMTENERRSLSPTKQSISSSISILTTIIHKLIRYFKWLFEPHTYKLIKTLETMLETKYEDALKHKDEGNKVTNLNDLIQLHALYKLLNLHKIDEILTQNLNVDIAFNDLYQASLAALTAAAEKASPLQH